VKTKIHSYYFDIAKPADKAAYELLRDQLHAMNLRCFETWGERSHYLEVAKGGVEVELETKHLFDNQWNGIIAGDDAEQLLVDQPGSNMRKKSAGRRVFDWAQDATVGGMNPKIKRGHWIEQTAEMREIRRNTSACGYCGRQEPAAKGYVFCPHCLDSEYLTEDELHLTRMIPVDQNQIGRNRRPPLTEAERAHLLPKFVEAQTVATGSRAKAKAEKARRDVVDKFKRKTSAAKIEHDGFIWLLDQHLPLDNVIYYDHTERFCFGWRTPLKGAVLSAFLDKLSEFPFDYDIKKVDEPV
jgi:hypothetical protein